MLIIRSSNFLSDYIFDGLTAGTKQQHDVLVHQTIREKGIMRLWQKVKKYFAIHCESVSLTSFYPSSYIAEIGRKASLHDTVFLFDIQNLKEILLLRRMLAGKRIVVFLWNPSKTFCRNYFSREDYIRNINKAGIEVLTFDEWDAKRFGFKLTGQPYRFPEKVEPEVLPEKDVFFVGLEKHRSGKLLEFLMLMKGSFSVTFYIQKDKHSQPIHGLNDFYHDRPLPYRETLKQISMHKAYLELLQDRQHGMTLRPLEAAFLGRKLITDNAAIRKSGLFHPSRILVLDENTTLNKIEGFLNSEFVPLNAGILEKHEINHWLSNIANSYNISFSNHKSDNYRIRISRNHEDEKVWILNIPAVFDSNGEIVQAKRNVIKNIRHNGVEYNVKSFHIPHPLNRIVYSFIRKPKSSRSFEHALRLKAMGFGTPEAVAELKEYSIGLLRRSYFVSLQLPREYKEIRTLYYGPLKGNEELLKSFTIFTARLHEAGVLHKDYSPGNILFKDDGLDFQLVDINRMMFCNVDIYKGCKNFSRLFGDEEIYHYIAKQYAMARNFDQYECDRLILKYYQRFKTRKKFKL